MKFSLHVLAAVYKYRFLLPPMELHTPRMMETLLESDPMVQASHLMENFKESSMNFNPLHLTLEVGEINKSRHACKVINNEDEYVATHPNEPRISIGRFSRMDPSVSCYPETSVTQFKCRAPQIHDPPCMGFNFAKSKVPAMVKQMWAKHLGKVVEKRQKRLEEQQRHAHMSRLEILKEEHDKIEKEMRKLTLARHRGKK